MFRTSRPNRASASRRSIIPPQYFFDVNAGWPIRIANDTAFGLGAAVFSRDDRRAERIAADELEAGAAFVNAFVRSDPRLPFGGVKESGYGRELARHGMLEFQNAKAIYVR